MKKLFSTILVLGLLLSGNAYAGLFSKNEFKFERCYTDSYTNHSDWIENSDFLRWEWEINLKNKTATRLAQLKSDGELRIEQLKIIAVTKEFIQVPADSDLTYIFFRKTGRIQTKSSFGTGYMFCEVFD